MTHPHDSNEHHDLPDALRWQLRALSRDVAPERDLWNGIAERIANTPQSGRATTPAIRRTSRRPLAIFATAATLALAVGLGWQTRPDATQALSTTTPAPVALSAETAAMVREYEAAVRKVEAARGMSDTPQVLAELDASAAAIRDALSQAPDSKFLFDRLQRVYAQRLSLTQRLPFA